MRQGFFERDPESGDRPTYRLRWLPEKLLSEREESYAKFVKYLISIGRISEATNTAAP